MHRSRERNAFTHCWRHVKFRDISFFCAWLNTSASICIRKYSLFCRSLFSSRPRPRAYPVDVTSCQEKESTRIIKGASERRRRRRRRRFSDGGSMRIVHSANTAQPRPVVLLFTDVPEVRAMWKKLCFLLAQRAVRTYVFFRSSSPCPSSLRRNLPRNASLLTANKMERRIAKRSCYWTRNGTVWWKKGKKKSDGRKGEKLIAAFCSAINDDEGPEGRETFRWLREDVLRCPLFPSSHLIHPFPRQSAYSQFLRRSPSSSRSLSTTITTTTSKERTMAIDPANDIKGKNTRGTRKRLRSLYTLQSAPFGRLLALES